MVAKYIPIFMGLGSILIAYRLFGGWDLIEGLRNKDIQEEYDYIVVGAGTTGGVLASRLAEDNDVQVLLIDAGDTPKDNPDIDIPIFTDKARGSEFDWSFSTVPQKQACKLHNDQSSIWPSGKGLGGTSNINYMQYLRGSRHDFDEWASQGAQGWSYKDVLPYFIKSEDNRNNDYTRTIFHGYGGRLTVSDTGYSSVNKIMQNTFKELGVKVRDINGRNMFGYMPTQATVRSGERCGVYRSFLKKAMTFDNLHVLKNSFVEKITFEGRRATGVIVQRGDDKLELRATKEVIVSAGTVGSAKLLMLSGVGPRQHLKDLKIPVVMDLPVGNNLQDHVMADGIEFYTPYSGISITAAKAENFLQSWSYSLFGGGMKASPRFREGTAYVKMKHQPPHIKYPLVALHVVANIDVYDAKTLNVKEESYEALHSKPPFKEGFTIFPVLLHPRSRGTVRLASDNPDDMPLINPNYLAEDADLKYLSDAYRFARTLTKMKPINDWEFQINNRLLPECARAGNFTASYVECFLKHITLSGYAPVGTCKMGAIGDPTAVVDPHLRVRGIKSLRVADASVIPNAISGNTYATQVMLGEKAADIIRDLDTVKAIREYFKHLLTIKHDKMKEEDEHTIVSTGTEDEASPTGQKQQQVPIKKAVAGKKGKKK